MQKIVANNPGKPKFQEFYNVIKSDTTGTSTVNLWATTLPGWSRSECERARLCKPSIYVLSCQPLADYNNLTPAGVIELAKALAVNKSVTYLRMGKLFMC